MSKRKKEASEMAVFAEASETMPTVSFARTLLRLKNGSVYEVLAEEGKYYVCDGARFRKGNPNIDSVTVIDAPEETEEPEATEEESEEKAEEKAEDDFFS